MNPAKTLTRGAAQITERIPVAPLPVRALLWLNYLPFLMAMHFNNFLCSVLKPLYTVVRLLYKITLRAEWQERFSPKDDRVWELAYAEEAMETFGGIKPYDRVADACTVRRAARNVLFALIRVAALIALMLWLGVL